MALDPKPATGDTTEEERPRSLSELAQAAFGDNYHPREKIEGLLQDETPSTEGVSEDETKEVDAETEEVEAVEEDTSEEEDSVDDQSQTDDADDAATDDEVIKTVAELRDHLEVDDEYLDGLKVDIGKVLGKASPDLSFGEVKALASKALANEERDEQAKAKAAAAAEQHKQNTAALEVQFATAGKVIETAEALLTAEMAEVDWDDLRESNPGQWAMERQRFMERTSAIEGLKSQVQQQFVDHYQTQMREANEKANEYVAQERGKLMEAMPRVNAEWGHAEKVPVLKARLADYAKSIGFTDEELAQTVDHRMLVVLEKARLHDAVKGKVDVAKKRVHRLPKIARPGASKTADVVNMNAERKARANLRKSGDINDALAVMRAKRKG